MVHATSGAYNSDLPYLVDDRSVDRDGRVSPGALQSLWTTHSKRFSESRKRILFAQDVATGKVQCPVPRKLAKNRRVFFPMLPQMMTMSLHNHNVLSRKEPRYKRYTGGVGIAPLSRATRIESWVDPYTKRLVSWDELIGMLQDEGELAWSVLPTEATVTPEPPPFEDADGTIRRTWWRDEAGRDLGEYRGREGAFRRDEQKTSDAYEEAWKGWRLDNPHMSVELIHATDCVPIGLRITGEGPTVDGILKRETFSRSNLLQKRLRWGAGYQMEPSAFGGTEDVILYTGLLPDGHGYPYLIYSVQGAAVTWWEDGEAGDWAIVDLQREYGMTRGLWGYEFGWHKSVRDPDQRGVPFMFPFGQAMLAKQAILGASIVNLYQRGVGARGIRPDPQAPPEAYLDGSEPRMIEWEPGGALPVLPGEVVDIAPAQMSSDARWLTAELSADVASEGPPAGAFGGEGADSGRERTMMRKHMEDAEAHIFSGGLRTMTRIGRSVLELECLLQRVKEWPPDPIVTDVLLAEGSPGERRQQLVTLDPDDIGGNNYRVD